MLWCSLSGSDGISEISVCYSLCKAKGVHGGVHWAVFWGTSCFFPTRPLKPFVCLVQANKHDKERVPRWDPKNDQLLTDLRDAEFASRGLEGLWSRCANACEGEWSDGQRRKLAKQFRGLYEGRLRGLSDG